MEKEEARERARKALEKMNEAQRARASAAIAGRVTALPEFRSARTVMVFLPLAGEVDTRPIAQAAISAGKRVASPKVSRRLRTMEARVVRDLEQDVAPGHYGISEPVTTEVVEPGEIDFVLVPGLAFDRRGRRVGRGAGYYDRYLGSDDFRGHRCAVAFACQVLRRVPADKTDIPVDCIVTERDIVRVQQGG
ncbi:MAG: 5-formyltetrahydrofolate cyclo-ligase [Planctomycetota bacterium]